MARYAETTSVSSEASRAEIERTLMRYGADAFLYGWQDQRAVIQFRARGRYVRFLLPLPDRADRAFTHTPAKRQARSPEDAARAYEQAVRQRWRALTLAIKAKLEAVEAGIAEFEAEFLAHIALPDGQTVGDWIRPQIAIAYERGEMPKMLPMLEGPKARPTAPATEQEEG